LYFSILRTNRNFRLLYLGQAISQLGDWFNAVAVYALLLDLTGSASFSAQDLWHTLSGPGTLKIGHGKVVGRQALALLSGSTAGA